MKKSLKYILIFLFTLAATSISFGQDTSFEGMVSTKMTDWQSTNKKDYFSASYNSFKGTIRGVAFDAKKGSTLSYEYACEMDSGQVHLLLVRSNDQIIWDHILTPSNSIDQTRTFSVPLKASDQYRIVIAGNSMRGNWEVHRIDRSEE